MAQRRASWPSGCEARNPLLLHTTTAVPWRLQTLGKGAELPDWSWAIPMRAAVRTGAEVSLLCQAGAAEVNRAAGDMCSAGCFEPLCAFRAPSSRALKPIRAYHPHGTTARVWVVSQPPAEGLPAADSQGRPIGANQASAAPCPGLADFGVNYVAALVTCDLIG